MSFILAIAYHLFVISSNFTKTCNEKLRFRNIIHQFLFSEEIIDINSNYTYLNISETHMRRMYKKLIIINTGD